MAHCVYVNYWFGQDHMAHLGCFTFE